MNRVLPYTITRTSTGYVAQHTTIPTIRFVGRNAADLGVARARVIRRLADELMDVIKTATPSGYPPVSVDQTPRP